MDEKDKRIQELEEQVKEYEMWLYEEEDEEDKQFSIKITNILNKIINFFYEKEIPVDVKDVSKFIRKIQ
jgi:hypothetical protein